MAKSTAAKKPPVAAKKKPTVASASAARKPKPAADTKAKAAAPVAAARELPRKKPAASVAAPVVVAPKLAVAKPGKKSGQAVIEVKASSKPTMVAAPIKSGTVLKKKLKKFRRPEPPPPQYVPPIQEALPTNTDGKPRKNLAGLGIRELEHFRELLLAKRRELVGDMSSMEREALRVGGADSNLSSIPVHTADLGTDNYEQEFTLGLVEKDRQLLREINIALGKIQNGTYGLCEGTGLPITKPRLEAQPWAKYSIEFARQREKNQFIRPRIMPG